MSELLAPTATEHRPAPATAGRAGPGPGGGPVGPPPVRQQRAHTSNPVRIGRIGTDQVRVFIRPLIGDGELLAVTERLEQLLDAGYDTIDVVFEEGSHTLSPLTRDTVITGEDTGTTTDAMPL